MKFPSRLSSAFARLAAWNLITVPIVAEARAYDRTKFRADLAAGITVAVMSLPQAIGFALIAGLPPQMVVASLLVGGFCAAVFNSSHQLIFGPTNTTSMFLAMVIHHAALPALSPAQNAVIIGFLIGAIQLAAGLARLGNLTQFVSRSVILGYSAGVAVVILVGQIPNLFGLAVPRDPRPLMVLWHTGAALASGEALWMPTAVSAGCVAAIFALRRWCPRWPETLVALVLATAAAAAWSLDRHGVRTVADLGALNAEWPGFAGVPATSSVLAAITLLMNATIALAVLGMLEAISISKNIAARTGQQVEPNQELIGIGAGNLLSSLFGAMPGSASFMRSEVNYQSGARTQFSAIGASATVGFGLLTLAPLVNHIPIPAVAAILLFVVTRMVNREHVRLVCRATTSDTLVFAATFAGTLLFNLDTALYLGIGLSLALFLKKAAQPALVEYVVDDSGALTELREERHQRIPQISIIHVEGDLFFGAADLFHEQIRYLAADDDIRVFILRMKNARHLDGSTVLALGLLHKHLRSQGRHLLISGIHGDVERVLQRSGLIHEIGAENVFPTEENPTLATKKALVRARALVGEGATGIRLFYPAKPEKISAAPARA